MFTTDKDCAVRLDQDDPLADLREGFEFPKRDGSEQERLYFCGHSLGLMPKDARRYIDQVVNQWAQLGVRGHFRGEAPFAPYHETLTEDLAQLVGAMPNEVVAMNTLTVNLHLMMVSFYQPTEDRHKIVIEAGAFPSDRYAVQSHVRHHQFDPVDAIIELAPRSEEYLIDEDQLLTLIEVEGDSIAMIMLPGVQYLTGQVFDMKRITEAAHAKGIKVGFDLAHAVGNIPLQCHDWGMDFACWCHYKYLNSGPGAVAGCFVHERHLKSPQLPRFSGWWGHDKETRFAMPSEFKPIESAEGWQLSNPPIFSMAPVRAALDMIKSAGGMGSLREKSIKMTAYLHFLLKALVPEQITVITPSEAERRGCQLSLICHQQPRKVYQTLSEQGVDLDWREPNVMRVAPVPMYNRFEELFEFVSILKSTLEAV